MPEHVVHGEPLGTGVETHTAVGGAVAPEDLPVVLVQHCDVLGRHGLARREEVLVDMLRLEKGDHGARDVRIRQRPLERSLRVRVGLVSEIGEALVLRPFEGLHGHHTHVLLGAGSGDDVWKRRPDAVVVGEHHHIEATRIDRGVRNLDQVRSVG